MAEKTSGIYKLVTIPGFYEFIQNSLGGASARHAFKKQFFGDIAGKRALEVGCGPGTWFPELADCAEYLGMDWNGEHIAQANQKYGSDNVRFVQGDVSRDIPQDTPGYDFVFAFGILHHLDDGQALSLLKSVSGLLSPEGRFISVDPVYHNGQNFFAKWMNDRDSGQNIRREQEYGALAKNAFANVATSLCTDKLRIPYSHCVVEAS